MALNQSFAKDTSLGGFVYGADQGMKYIVGAAQPGKSIVAFKVTASGSPMVLTFAGQGLPNMANASYVVICQGETAARVTIDESTATVAGFSILGAGAAEVVHILVVGQVAGQAAV